MKRIKVIAVVALVIIVLLTAAVFAQQRQQTQQRQQASREEAITQMTERLAEQLELTKEEEGIVMPEIRKLLMFKLAEMPNLRDLRNLQNNPSASPEEITAALKKFRMDLAEARTKIAEAERKFADMPQITPRRELILTIAGILDNGQGLTRTGVRRTEAGANRPRQQRN